MKTENRIGTFTLSGDYLREWQELLPLMGNFVIVRCEYMYANQQMVYTAYSPLFDVSPEECAIPEYNIQITLNDFGPATVIATRK